MSFTLRILGTASAMPISDRNPSAQVLCVQGRLFLIDCGEGTQQMMRKLHLSFLKVEAVFISHIHGDHVFGLFGLLSTMTMYNRTQTLHIFGPEALRSIIRFYLSFFADGSNYTIEFHEVKVNGCEHIYDSKDVRVSAFPLHHKIECYGYRFDEILSERSLEKRRAVSYAYCSDTMPFPALSDFVKGVMVLYHECTYTQDLADKAGKYFHSSTSDAAKCALACGAEKLIIGHYSSRIRDVKVYETECKKIFPETIAAVDGDIFEIK